jgi:pyruvate/oxaloacetate carboxyltransferase
MDVFVKERLERYMEMHPKASKLRCRRDLEKTFDGMTPYSQVEYYQESRLQVGKKLKKIAKRLMHVLEPSSDSEPAGLDDDIMKKVNGEEEEVEEDEKKWRAEESSKDDLKATVVNTNHRRTLTQQIFTQPIESAPLTQEEAPKMTQTPSAPAFPLRISHGSKLQFYYNRRPSVTTSERQK